MEEKKNTEKGSKMYWSQRYCSNVSFWSCFFPLLVKSWCNLMFINHKISTTSGSLSSTCFGFRNPLFLWHNLPSPSFQCTDNTPHKTTMTTYICLFNISKIKTPLKSPSLAQQCRYRRHLLRTFPTLLRTINTLPVCYQWELRGRKLTKL